MNLVRPKILYIRSMADTLNIFLNKFNEYMYTFTNKNIHLLTNSLVGLILWNQKQGRNILSQFWFLYFHSSFIRETEIDGKVEVMTKQHGNGYLLSNSVVESKHSHLAWIPVIIIVHTIPLQTEFSVNIGKFDKFLLFFFCPPHPPRPRSQIIKITHK